MSHLTKYEKETILLTNEGDDTYSVYTFNPGLKRKLADYSRKYPELCRLISFTQEGSETYEIDKARISIGLTAPYSEERKKAAGERAKQLNADKASQG
jgi:hypothetical protein